MKKGLGSVIVCTLLIAAPAFSGDKNKDKTTGSKEQTTDTTTTTDTGTSKVSTDTLYGEVKDYQPGKSITISTPGKTEGERTIDLSDKDLTARVNARVKVGDWVKLTEKTGKNGHKTVSVSPSKHAARTQQQ